MEQRRIRQKGQTEGKIEGGCPPSTKRKLLNVPAANSIFHRRELRCAEKDPPPPPPLPPLLLS